MLRTPAMTPLPMLGASTPATHGAGGLEGGVMPIASGVDNRSGGGDGPGEYQIR